MSHKYLPLSVFGDTSSIKFIKDEVKLYGYEYISMPSKKRIFNVLGKTEFMRLLKADQSTLSLTESLIRHQLTIKKLPIERRCTLPRNEYRLNVFNSSSYALPHLVNLFSLQSRLSLWRAEYVKAGLKGAALKTALQLLRLGVSPISLYRHIIFDPRRLEGIKIHPSENEVEPT
jgi:hypothetical protein